MSTVPLISIVMPVFDDEATVDAALQSALDQTLSEVEIICVDDASTDGTPAVIEAFAARDPRVRLIRHGQNRSAFQARRTGVLAASAEHVLFLDGDDELVPDAAAKVLARAHETAADIVGFGVTVIERDGRTGGSYERRLQPAHATITGGEVLRGLFPIGKPAQGQLWRYLFRTRLLREAQALLPDDLALARVNDLPLMFLAASLATSFASIGDKLYRYHFGRGGSGHRVDSIDRARFYTSAITSAESVRSAVSELAGTHPEPELLRDSYESMRLSIIGYVCSQLIAKSDRAVLDAALAHLYTVASEHDVIFAAARFYPATLSTLKFQAKPVSLTGQQPRSILLATSVLRTGGVSAVLASQARYLHESGFRVTIVARSAGSDPRAIPAGVAFVELTGRDLLERLEAWAEICRTHDVDVVIDHQVLYTQYWPEFALMARAEGAATIGWVHNFVARPIYDGSSQLSLIERCAGTLAQLVVLSPLDVAYLKLRGVRHTAYLPNPPSPLLVASTPDLPAKHAPAGRIELAWWGRLEQHTKQVYELIAVGVELRKLKLDFRLTVIGPGWDDVTSKKFNTEARRRRVGDRVRAVGPLHGTQLLGAIDAADAFVSTSVIEGYQLTIAEAQSRGLPVFMYELPWLVLTQDNEGVVSVPQGDAPALARQIADVMRTPARYAALSDAAVVAADRALTHDFATLYERVVVGALPQEFSPEPTLEDARELLRLLTFFAERSHAHDRNRVRMDSAFGTRLWQAAAPLGRATLQRLPGLRPLAHRLKGRLGAR